MKSVTYAVVFCWENRREIKINKIKTNPIYKEDSENDCVVVFDDDDDEHDDDEEDDDENENDDENDGDDDDEEKEAEEDDDDILRVFRLMNIFVMMITNE